jgi:Domain of unknown function (DUF397)
MNQADLSRAVWRTSSRSSANSQCVEVAFVDDTVATRDSKNNAGPVLLFTNDQWQTFVNNGRIPAR